MYNESMSFSIFTYNTLFNNAVDGIRPILDKYQPDIICLQEVKTDERNLKRIEKMGWRLADYANSFVRYGQFYGVATFYNQKKFQHLGSDALYPGSNIVEILFTLLQVILGYKKPKTFLKTDFRSKIGRKTVSICNIHLYVVGSNALRVKHIKQAINLMNTSGPLVLTGDFNYFPYQRRMLENFMKKQGFTEATRNISQTIKFTKDVTAKTYSLFQKFSLKIFGRILENLKIDYIFFRKLKLKSTKRIEVRLSDHFPIISKFEI